MTDITTLLQTAITDEPPMRMSHAEVIRRGRAAHRRGRAVVGAAASVGVLGAAAVAATLVTGASSGTHHHGGTASLGQLAAAADQHAAVAARVVRSKSGSHVGAITAGTLAGLVEHSIGVSLVGAEVSGPAQAGDLDLAAGIGVAGHPYLNVQVVPAGGINSASESCADLNVLSSPDSDGYTGPCSLQHLSDGSVLIVRSGQTATGGYAKAQADLILANGTGILAEDTNQAADLWPAERQLLATSGGAKALPPVVSSQPPLSSAVMSRLAQDLAAAED